MTTPHVSIETITPEIAESYLAMNVENRSIRPATVERYAAEMTAGQWRFTGEPIQFSGDRLLNGQHRLLACIKSQQSITVVVVRNVESQAFEVMDSGMKRTLGDVVRASMDIPNSSTVAAGARLVLAMERSEMRVNEYTRSAISRHDILHHITEHHDLYEITSRLANRAREACGFRPTAVIAFVVYLVRLGADQAVAMDFIERTISGNNLPSGDPRLALRNWMTRREIVKVDEEISVIIHAWNAWTNNESRKIVKRISRGDAVPKVIHLAPVDVA